MRLRRRLPRQLVWEVTARCNLRCSHCFNVWTAPKAALPVDLDTAGARAVIANIAASRIPLDALTLTGGEPTLRPDLALIAREVRAHLPSTSIAIASNGFALDSTAAHILKDSGVTTLQLTFLSTHPAEHDAMVGRLGAFDRVLEAMIHARTAGLRVVVFFVAMRDNVHRFEGVAALARALGADGVVFNRFQPGGRGLVKAGELSPTPVQLQSVLDAIDRLEPIVAVRLGTPIPPCERREDQTRGRAMRCPVGTRHAYPTVGPNGTLRPCNHSDVEVGTLACESLTDLLQHPSMRSAPPAAKECASCSWLGECGGGCPSACVYVGKLVYASRDCFTPD